MKCLLAKWRTGRYATSNIKIYYNELNIVLLADENIQLRSKKREHEELLSSQKCKIAKLEKKVEHLKKNLNISNRKSIRDNKKTGGQDKRKSFC